MTAARAALGAALRSLGDYAQAQAVLVESTEIDSSYCTNKATFTALTALYRSRGEFARALSHAEHLLRAQPDDRHVLITVAWVLIDASESPYGDLADLPRAEELLRQADVIPPRDRDHVAAVRALAEAYRHGADRSGVESQRLAQRAELLERHVAVFEGRRGSS
jgi:tetratricopeptide (TPR) repeat protein